MSEETGSFQSDPGMRQPVLDAPTSVESAAWLAIAERVNERIVEDPYGGFLCNKVRGIRRAGLISDETEQAMLGRVQGHVLLLPDIDRSFREPSAYETYDGDERASRILAALWMALEAEEVASEPGSLSERIPSSLLENSDTPEKGGR